jgi:hypothetical protein
MKRLFVRWLILGLAIVACGRLAEAGPFSRKTREQRQAQREQYPPKYVRVPNAQNYVFKDKNGQVHVRKVPSGYAEGFPTPALFYYGYPHSGDDTGLGF